MKKIILCICFLLIGLAIGYYVGTHKPKTIAMRFSPVGDLIVGASQGTTLKWPVPVNFPHVNPCDTGSNPAQGTCILKDNLLHKFGCAQPGCSDPVVGGGDDVIIFTATATGAAAILAPPYATPATSYVYCDNANKAQADAVTASVGPPAQGYTTLPDSVSTYTIHFTGTNPCDPGGDLTTMNPNCRIKAGTTPTTYPYTIAADSCTQGSGALTVTP